jgi:hypothetical protein
MWSYEYSVEADVTAAAVWAAWSKVTEWGTWNSDIEAISIDGPFEAGTSFSMTPVGQDALTMKLVDVVKNERFTDVCDFEGILVRTLHQVSPSAEGRVTITYRTEITGPGSDQVGPEIGPQITADFPETLEALVKHVTA